MSARPFRLRMALAIVSALLTGIASADYPERPSGPDHSIAGRRLARRGDAHPRR